MCIMTLISCSIKNKKNFIIYSNSVGGNLKNMFCGINEIEKLLQKTQKLFSVLI